MAPKGYAPFPKLCKSLILLLNYGTIREKLSSASKIKIFS